MTASTGAQSGDIGIIFIRTPTASTLPTTTGQTPAYINASDGGWTAVTGSPWTAQNCQFYAFWRRLDGTSNQDSPQSGATTITCYNRIDVRGAIASGTPIEAPAANNEAADTSLTIASITSTGADRLWVAGCAINIDSNADQFSAWANSNFADPAITEAEDICSNVGSGATPGGVGSAYGGLAGDADGVASGDTTATTGSGGRAWVSFFVVPVASTTYTDAMSGVLSIAGTRTESNVIAYTDVGAGTVAISGARVESQSFDDVRSGSFSLVGTWTEVYEPPGATYDDFGSGILALTGAATEVYEPPTIYTDVGSGVLSIAGQRVESASVADSASGILALSGTATESQIIGFNDVGTGTLTLTGSASESQSIADSSSGALTLSGQAAESASYVDSASGVISLTGTATEANFVGFNDTGTGSLVITGAGVESQTHTATATGIFQLAGYRVESLAIVDDGTGSLVITGTATESWEAGTDDYGFGILGLTGAAVESQTHTGQAAGTLALVGYSWEDFWAGAYDDSGIGTIEILGAAHDMLFSYQGAGDWTYSGTADRTYTYSGEH